MSLNLLKGLKEAGHDQLAVTYSSTDGEFGSRLRQIGVEEVMLPLGFLSKKLSLQAMWWTAKSVFLAPVLWLRWHRLVSRFRPDIVILTNPKQGLWLYPWLGRQSSFLIEHSSKQISSSNRWMYRTLNRKLTGFIAASRFMATHLEELGVSKSHCTVIYNCVNSTVGPRSTNKSTGTQKTFVGIVGQISRHKGHDDLLKAAASLKKRGVPLEVKVFGTGHEQYILELKAKVARNGLEDSWKWMSYIPQQSSIFSDIDICVVPSCFDEPFGMVALEASFYGLPVVASRRGGLPEIVEDGRTGFLVQSDNPTQLAERIERLILNPELARTMGNAGRQKVMREFSQTRMLASYEGLFREAVTPSKS
jgi:glycosyltransferase involved in cell wall biosynthesis